jgi:predicted phage tail protein
MVSIKLHGKLGSTIGRKWSLDVSSVGEALRAIETNTQKLFHYLYTKDREGIEYRVIINGRDHKTEEELVMRFGALKTIDIVPVPSGAGKNGGLFSILAGVVLIGAAIALAVYTGPAGATLLASLAASQIATSMASFGAALVLGGLLTLVSGSPKSSFGTEGNQDDELAASYIFSGPVNTIAQGNPVPVGYGRLRIGSQVIASGLSTVRTL